MLCYSVEGSTLSQPVISPADGVDSRARGAGVGVWVWGGWGGWGARAVSVSVSVSVFCEESG